MRIARGVQNKVLESYLEMNITSNEESWIVYFSIELNAPIIEFETLFINDNDDGILDPGETADIYVSFKNNGGASAYNTFCEITETDPYVTLNSAIYELGTFTSGSIMTAMYNISIAGNAQIGYIANVFAEINADMNYSNTSMFILQIGFAYTNEGFETGDFTNLDWVMGGSADWTISTDAVEGIYCAKSGNITLKKGIFIKDNNFWKWVGAIKMNTIKRETVVIQLLDESAKPIMTWKVGQSFAKLPSKSIKRILIQEMNSINLTKKTT